MCTLRKNALFGVLVLLCTFELHGSARRRLLGVGDTCIILSVASPAPSSHVSSSPFTLSLLSSTLCRSVFPSTFVAENGLFKVLVVRWPVLWRTLFFVEGVRLFTRRSTSVVDTTSCIFCGKLSPSSCQLLLLTVFSAIGWPSTIRQIASLSRLTRTVCNYSSKPFRFVDRKRFIVLSSNLIRRIRNFTISSFLVSSCCGVC